MGGEFSKSNQKRLFDAYLCGCFSLIYSDPVEVSVILPFYNAESTLQRAIESIYHQDMKQFECLLVDNNSTDGSREIAEDWCAKDPRFRLIEESRQGVMFASNKGALASSGEFLARMDADDVSLPSRLRLQSEFLKNHPDHGAVAGRVVHVGDPEKTGGFKRYVEWSNSVCSYQEIFLRRFIEAPIVNPTAMWRRSIMEQHGMYRSGPFPEDYELWLRWPFFGRSCWLPTPPLPGAAD